MFGKWLRYVENGLSIWDWRNYVGMYLCIWKMAYICWGLLSGVENSFSM